MNCAATAGDVKMMKLIIRLGGDINKASGCGTTPILIAAKQNDLAMARTLLEAGADPNAASDNNSPLSTAIQNRNQKMVNLLLKYHAKDINIDTNTLQQNNIKP